jgi:hypothetical protein
MSFELHHPQECDTSIPGLAKPHPGRADWHDFLVRIERIDRAETALRRLGKAIADATDEAPAWAVAELLNAAAEGLSFGPPLPPLTSAMADADWWADFATRPELKAYTLASYRRLPERDKRAFLQHVGASA